MKTKRYVSSTVIDGDIGQVWKALVDAESLPQWTPSMKTVSLAGTFSIGASVRIKQPKLPEATWVVTEIVAGRSFAWETTALGVRTKADHILTEAGRQTRVTYRITQTGWLAPLVALVSAKLTRRYVDSEIVGLKNNVESSIDSLSNQRDRRTR